MERTKEYDATVASGIIAIFQSQSYKLERVMAEFIDNSLQSYLDHENELKQMLDAKVCQVKIIWDDSSITITDNAFGMNDEEFGRAIKLKSFNPRSKESNRLSVYGMGLKYAAVYLGNHYQIESSQYNEGCTRQVDIDVPSFEQNNPTTVTAHIFDCLKDEHSSKIKITSLRVHRTSAKEEDLRQKLAVIYHYFIQNSKLQISVNEIPVSYSRPQFRKKESGGTYCEQIDSSFTSETEEYKISGWIGILPKGDQTKTGFNLIQANRCIQLGYKPQRIFGKGNSFQSSRMIGEIVFEGNHNIVSFDKDKFVWADNGAEDAFIDKLLSLPGVTEIISACKKLKKEMNEDEIKTKTYGQLNDDLFEIPDKNNGGEITKPSNEQTDSSAQPISNNNSGRSGWRENNPEVENPDPRYKKLVVNTTNGKEYLYTNVYYGETSDDWLKLEKYCDGYLLHINFNNEYIAKNFSNEKAVITSNGMGILICTSVLNAQGSGLRLGDSIKLLEYLNLNMRGKIESNE